MFKCREVGNLYCMATITLPAKHTPTWTMADRMWKARKDAGLTAQQIADAIGISRKSVTNYESGTTKPLRPILRAWAEVTGTYEEWLEDGTDPFLPAATGTQRSQADSHVTPQYARDWSEYASNGAEPSFTDADWAEITTYMTGVLA